MSEYSSDAADAGEWPYRVQFFEVPPSVKETRTAERKAAFLRAFGRVELGGSRSLAASEAGVTTRTVRLWVERDEEFREALEHLDACHAELVEARTHWAALQGDVQAAKLVLTAKLPEKYGTKRVDVQHTINKPGKDIIASLYDYCGRPPAPEQDEYPDDEDADDLDGSE